MLVFSSSKSIKDYISTLRKENSIGFVPTMGALHLGHLSLIVQAKTENDVVVVSIFVNPTQFDKKEDLNKYPRTIEEDLKLLQSVNCDVVFIPSIDEMYEDKITSEHFDFGGIEFEMEGKFRKGHFDGVGTIVKKLFEIVMPQNAYFGEKDFQQLQIVKKLVEITKLPIKIIGCKIFREKDGLAMSSRNIRLSEEQRKAAPFIYQTLLDTQQKFGIINANEIKQWVEEQFVNNEFLKLEYFEIACEDSLKPANECQEKKNYRAFIAVFVNDIRLIDNIRLGN
ncbi:MAG: pantoate--beta-alanine ligase [Flavobacteriaceae bacterium]|nr:pantoate--beta-alanine ligase [Flavobacteriaceae bacterium]